MKLPNGEVLMDTDENGLRHVYDPAKAHEYYMKVRKLKGRKKGSAPPPAKGRTASPPPAKGRVPAKAVSGPARARKKQEIQVRIQGLEKKLRDLEALIRKKEAAAKKSAKEAAKPDTAAEKSEKARDAKKYRDKNQQKVKAAAKKAAAKSGGGSDTKKASADKSVTELKSLATKVKGQIAVAKQKLAAL